MFHYVVMMIIIMMIMIMTTHWSSNNIRNYEDIISVWRYEQNKLRARTVSSVKSTDMC